MMFLKKTTARQRLLAPGRSVLSSDELAVLCLEAFGAPRDGERDRLAYWQAARPVCLDSREMHENIVA